MKKSPLKRKPSKLKRSPLRRKSKDPRKKAKDDADRALQDWYRAKYPKNRCEACGGQFEVMHHFIAKSQSNYLRYDDRNLIFLCQGCHYRHHNVGDQKIMSTVILKRGEKWHKEIIKESRKQIGPYTLGQYREIYFDYTERL